MLGLDDEERCALIGYPEPLQTLALLRLLACRELTVWRAGGMRRNWLERFFHLDSAGVLTYYAGVNTVRVKRGGGMKNQLHGHDPIGSIDMKTCRSVRLGTAPNRTDAEFEVLTDERTYRFRVGRTSGGHRVVADPAAAALTWVGCIALANVAALEPPQAGGPGRELSAALAAVQQSLKKNKGLLMSHDGDELDAAVLRALECPALSSRLGAPGAKAAGGGAAKPAAQRAAQPAAKAAATSKPATATSPRSGALKAVR